MTKGPFVVRMKEIFSLAFFYVFLLGSDAFAELKLDVTVDQVRYLVGEPVQYAFAATNDSEEELKLWFPTNQQISIAFDRDLEAWCGGGHQVTELVFAPHQTYTWTGTTFFSEPGMHTFSGRICHQEPVAEPVTFFVDEPPPVVDDVLIDFERYPDGTSTVGHRYLRDAYAVWGVQFQTSQISDAAYVHTTRATDFGFAILANLKMPVFGVTARVATAVNENVTMFAFDQNGQEIAAVASRSVQSLGDWEELRLSTIQPIASLMWKPSITHAAVLLDALALTVQTVLPVPTPGSAGDINRDGTLDANDLDLISAELLSPAPRLEFDFDNSGHVNQRGPSVLDESDGQDPDRGLRWRRRIHE